MSFPVSNFVGSDRYEDFKHEIDCNMAFRKLFFDWPLPDRTRPVRLDRIRCWFDGEPIVVDIFCRDLYCQEVMTIPPRTLLWNILFDFYMTGPYYEPTRKIKKLRMSSVCSSIWLTFFDLPWCANELCFIWYFNCFFYFWCYTPSGTLYILSTIGVIFYSEIIVTNPESSPPHLCSCLN